MVVEVINDGGKAGRTGQVLSEIAAERHRQDAKWGEQNHPDGTGGFQEELDAHNAKVNCERAAAAGCGEWRHILAEEMAEAFAAVGPELRAELVQVAAVAVAWIEAIDRRERIASPYDALAAE